MYTTIDYKTKTELKRAVADGKEVGVYQPNDMFGKTEQVQVGRHEVTLEGPHFPKPHKWYAEAIVVDGKIVGVI